MRIEYTWRNTEKSEATEQLLHKKLEKLEKHVDHVTTVHISLETINKQEHVVKANVHLTGIEIHAAAAAEDMYKAIDAMTHKLIRQIEAHKAKHIEHRHDQKIMEEK